VWGTERWSSSGFAYDIPVSAGTPVYVNLYMGNQCECTNTAGARLFDVLIDGNLVLDNLDLTGTYGHQVGHLFQFEIISDGTIDVDFVNVVENPLLNALEISLAGPQPNVLGISQPSIDFGPVLFASGSESQVITLTNLGETGDPSIEVSGIAKTGSAEFTLTGLPTLPLTLAPGATDTFNVVYDPVDAGFDVGTVTITHTGDNGPTSTIDLEGEGVSNLPVAFGASGLPGVALSNPTSLEFGPDDRLYVSQQNGTIKAYDIVRNGPNNYAITETETINLITDIQNHNDDGTVNNTKQRQVTGLMTAGTALNPELYVTSSDWRIAVGDDSNLDTNSGVLSKLTWNGTSWDHVQLVRGLPRSEENHSTNGMDLDPVTNTLYVMSGGHTNKGAPGNNFSGTPEYALSAAILSVDLDFIEGLDTQEVLGSNGSMQYWKYNLPTLDDPTRTGNPDNNDPFGGNNGLNQARWVAGGPVQVYSGGYRNAYDVVYTEAGRIYTYDNGPNTGWGGIPVGEGPGGTCTNEFNEANSTGYGDGLHYVPAGYYGGHPNPTRGNPDSGLYVYTEVSNGNWQLATITGNPFAWSDFNPTAVDSGLHDPRECDYQIPGVEDGALAVVGASTNGIAEYTASNFGGAMQGDLLAASFNGNVYRYQLNAAGDDITSGGAIFSNFGSQPLDVTTQGDSDPFPGTVWAVTYGANNVTVFEPNDFDGGGRHLLRGLQPCPRRGLRRVLERRRDRQRHRSMLRGVRAAGLRR
jgi:large repetitive protein